VTESALHLVFSPSAAGSLREALSKLGRRDQVVALFDDLSFGPIDPPDPSLRAAWIEEELGWTGWDEVVREEVFWTAAKSDAARPTVWMSRRSACEYAGFLEFVWRLGDRPCDVVDLTDRGYRTRFGGDEPIRGFGQVTADEMIANDFISDLTPLSMEARESYRNLWRILREENAALRTFGPDGRLRSAAISFYDDELLAQVKPERWTRSARVVGEVLASFIDTGFSPVGDLVLAGRLAALADAGRIEATGDLPGLQGSEVRLAAE